MNNRFKTTWGWSLHINLKECSPDRIRNIEDTKQFLLDLTKYIKMTPYGEPMVVHFGKDPSVTGISGYQLLEESNIGLHLVEQDNSAYIDIFSCCEYNSTDAYLYCYRYFEAQGGSFDFLDRGIN